MGTKCRTVPSVDLNSYVGLWMEVVRMPNDFQDDIVNDGSGFSACRNVTGPQWHDTLTMCIARVPRDIDLGCGVHSAFASGTLSSIVRVVAVS